MNRSNQRQFTDPFGNEWTISVEEVDGKSRYFQTVVTSDGRRQTEHTPVRGIFARLSRRRFQELSNAALWYLADETRPADKLSGMVEAAPDWIDDVYRDEVVTPAEANQHTTGLLTPLIRAVQVNNPQAVEALLKCGAHPLRGSNQPFPLNAYELARDELKLGVLRKMVANVAHNHLPLDTLYECQIAVQESERTGSIPIKERSHLKYLKDTLGERIDELSRNQAPLESSPIATTKQSESTTRKTLP